MGFVPTWPRQLCSVIVALMVALLVAVPTLDPVLCGNDDLPVASSQAMQSVSAHRDAAPVKHSHGAPAECPHGHCHHAAPMAADSPFVETAHGLAGVGHAIEPVADHHSAHLAGLMRPPRV